MNDCSFSSIDLFNQLNLKTSHNLEHRSVVPFIRRMMQRPSKSKGFIVPISESYSYRDEKVRRLREERMTFNRRDLLSSRSSSALRVETFDRSRMHNSQRSFGYGDIPSAKYVKRRNSLARPVIEETIRAIAAVNNAESISEEKGKIDMLRRFI